MYISKINYLKRINPFSILNNYQIIATIYQNMIISLVQSINNKISHDI